MVLVQIGRSGSVENSVSSSLKVKHYGMRSGDLKQHNSTVKCAIRFISVRVSELCIKQIQSQVFT